MVEDNAEGWDGKPGAQSSHERDGALIQLTLFAIEGQMSKKRRNIAELPVAPHHPFVDVYRSRKAFTELPEKSVNDLQKTSISESSDETHGDRGSKDFEKELRFILETKNTVDVETTLSAEAKDSKVKITSEVSEPDSIMRRMAQWQMAQLCLENDTLVTTVQDLIDQFVPKYYPHPLLKKCWGSIHIINEVCVLQNQFQRVAGCHASVIES